MAQAARRAVVPFRGEYRRRSRQGWHLRAGRYLAGIGKQLELRRRVATSPDVRRPGTGLGPERRAARLVAARFLAPVCLQTAFLCGLLSLRRG